jgi:hypothetical protein
MESDEAQGTHFGAKNVTTSRTCENGYPEDRHRHFDGRELIYNTRQDLLLFTGS